MSIRQILGKVRLVNWKEDNQSSLKRLVSFLRYLREVTRTTAADKLAVVDALYRFAAGLDLHDQALLKSSLAENALSDFRPALAKAGIEYHVLEGRDAIVTALTQSLGFLDTSHTVSNPRVTFDGNKAHLDALVEAQHVPRNDPSRHYMMKNRYDVELVKEGGVWVILRNTVDNIWRQGDATVLSVV